jgi:hypothetical protein
MVGRTSSGEVPSIVAVSINSPEIDREKGAAHDAHSHWGRSRWGITPYVQKGVLIL